MSDKKIVAFALVTLTGTAFYQVSTREHGEISTPASSPPSPSVLVADCVDCVEGIYDSCDMTVDSCLDSSDCSEWVDCTELCINSQADETCYQDCDLAHSDSYNESSSMKNCMCDVCTGQCVDMCMADG